MTKHGTKLISIISTVVLLASIIPLNSITSFGQESNKDFIYKVDDKEAMTAKISAYIGNDSNVTIPKTIDGYTIIGLEWGGLSDAYSIETLNLSDVFTNADFTTNKVPNLSSINVDSNNTEFSSEDGVLYSKTKGSIQFLPPKKVGNLKIADNVRYLSQYNGSSPILKNADRITSIHIPSCITRIFGSDFYSCTSLQSISFDNKNNDFYVDSNNNIYSKDKKELIKCNPNQRGTFTVLDGTTKIDANAFTGDNRFSAVYIPASVTSLDNAFENAKNIENIYVSDDSISFCSVDGILYNKDQSKLIVCPVNKTGNVTIGKNVSNLYQGLLKADKIENIYVSTENTNFSDINGVVYNKDQTELIMCPNGRSGDLVIKEGVTSIGNQLYYCNRLNSVKIPSTVDYINSDAFMNCENLENIYVDSSNKDFKDINGFLCDSQNFLLHSPIGKSDVLVVPDGILGVNSNAFYPNDNITSLTLPEGIQSLSAYSISKLEKLKSVMLPQSLTYIDSYAFYDCISLTDIVLPQDLTYLGGNTFERCFSLTNIVIPNKVTQLEFGLFSKCYNLKSVKFGMNISKIVMDSFLGCYKLNKLLVLNSNCEIEADSIFPYTIIRGLENSTAQTYANENGIVFENAIIKGDINFDEHLTLMDAKLLMLNIADAVVLNDVQKLPADVNNDGYITLADARQLLKYIADSID